MNLYGERWNVELLFKRWKSLGGLGHSQGTKEDRLVVEVYAKLLGALLRHHMCVLTTLTVHHNMIRSMGAVDLCDSIQHCRVLVNLNEFVFVD